MEMINPGDGLALILDEGQRQMVILALAHLAVERPGWGHAITEIVSNIDNVMPDGKCQMYESLKALRAEHVQAREARDKFQQGDIRVTL